MKRWLVFAALVAASVARAENYATVTIYNVAGDGRFAVEQLVLVPTITGTSGMPDGDYSISVGAWGGNPTRFNFHLTGGSVTSGPTFGPGVNSHNTNFDGTGTLSYGMSWNSYPSGYNPTASNLTSLGWTTSQIQEGGHSEVTCSGCVYKTTTVAKAVNLGGGTTPGTIQWNVTSTNRSNQQCYTTQGFQAAEYAFFIVKHQGDNVGLFTSSFFPDSVTRTATRSDNFADWAGQPYCVENTLDRICYAAGTIPAVNPYAPGPYVINVTADVFPPCPTPSPSPTPIATPTASPSATASATPTIPPSPTPTPKANPTPSPSASSSPPTVYYTMPTDNTDPSKVPNGNNAPTNQDLYNDVRKALEDAGKGSSGNLPQGPQFGDVDTANRGHLDDIQGTYASLHTKSQNTATTITDKAKGFRAMAATLPTSYGSATGVTQSVSILGVNYEFAIAFADWMPQISLLRLLALWGVTIAFCIMTLRALTYQH